jgi:hypothetical protein
MPALSCSASAVQSRISSAGANVESSAIALSSAVAARSRHPSTLEYPPYTSSRLPKWCHASARSGFARVARSAAWMYSEVVDGSG